MNLRGIIAVSGKPGLFKVASKTKTGFVLESLDGRASKMIVNTATAKMSSLEDITIFANESDLKLKDVFERMKQATHIPEPKTSEPDQLHTFFNEVAPQYDAKQVYSSDIKKIITWFNIIKDLPFFSEETPEPLENSPLSNLTEREKKSETPPSPDKKGKPSSKAAVKPTTRLSQKSK